jgi:hypothetical protein
LLSFDFKKQIIKLCSVNLSCEEEKLSVVPLRELKKNLSAESIILFIIKHWTIKFSFFEWQIRVDPLLNGSTDFNASTDFVPSCADFNSLISTLESRQQSCTQQTVGG